MEFVHPVFLHNNAFFFFGKSKNGRCTGVISNWDKKQNADKDSQIQVNKYCRFFTQFSTTNWSGVRSLLQQVKQGSTDVLLPSNIFQLLPASPENPTMFRQMRGTSIFWVYPWVPITYLKSLHLLHYIRTTEFLTLYGTFTVLHSHRPVSKFQPGVITTSKNKKALINILL